MLRGCATCAISSTTNRTSSSSSRRWARRPMRWNGCSRGCSGATAKNPLPRSHGCANITPRSSTTSGTARPVWNGSRRCSPNWIASPPRRSTVRPTPSCGTTRSSPSANCFRRPSSRSTSPRREWPTIGSTCAVHWSRSSATRTLRSISTPRHSACWPKWKVRRRRSSWDRVSSAAHPTGRLRRSAVRVQTTRRP